MNSPESHPGGIGPESVRKAVIVGAYGCGNIGDDAILAGLLRIFSWPRWSVTVLAADVPGIEGGESIPRIRQQLNLGLSWSVLKAFDFGKILTVIRRSDLLVIGGGALLHDLRFYNLPYYFMLQAWAGLWKVPVIYMDIGAGPIRTRTGKWLCRRFLSKAAGISVRDARGKEWITGAGVRHAVTVTADPAFLLTPEDVPADRIRDIARREKIPEKFIAVTACGWFKSEDFWKKKGIDLSASVKRMAEVLDWLTVKTGDPLVFFPTVVPYDRELAAAIRKEMQHPDRFHWLEADYTVESLMGLFGKANWLFGMRLHSMILSTIVQVPVFAVVYDQKVANFMQAIDNPHYASLEQLYEEVIFDKLAHFIDGFAAMERESLIPEKWRQILQDDFRQVSRRIFQNGHPES